MLLLLLLPGALETSVGVAPLVHKAEEEGEEEAANSDRFGDRSIRLTVTADADADASNFCRSAVDAVNSDAAAADNPGATAAGFGLGDVFPDDDDVGEAPSATAWRKELFPPENGEEFPPPGEYAPGELPPPAPAQKRPFPVGTAPLKLLAPEKAPEKAPGETSSAPWKGQLSEGEFCRRGCRPIIDAASRSAS